MMASSGFFLMLLVEDRTDGTDKIRFVHRQFRSGMNCEYRTMLRKNYHSVKADCLNRLTICGHLHVKSTFDNCAQKL